MSLEKERLHSVRDAIDTLTAAGLTELRFADVGDHLREQGRPLGSWEIRALFRQLEAAGELELDPRTATWRRVAAGGQVSAGG